MKKYLLITSVLLVSSGFAFLKNDTQTSKKEVSLQKNEKKFVKPLLNPLSDTTSPKEVVSEVTVNDLEKKYSGLSDAELETELALNHKFAEEIKLFERANKTGLDNESSKLMVNYIRVNRVLNQILLDRKISEIESEVL